MKRRSNGGSRAAMFVVLIGIGSVASAVEPELNRPPDGFRSLFDGKDLGNWRGQIAEDPREIAEITKGLSRKETIGPVSRCRRQCVVLWSC